MPPSLPDAPSSLFAAGQERGRTIPLSEVTEPPANSIHHDELGAVDGIAREGKIANAYHLLAGPGEENEIFQLFLTLPNPL
jgi:hypothetical protein